MGTIGFIGAGNMAEAMIKGIITAKLYPPGNIVISDVRPQRLKELADKYSIMTSGSNKDLVSKADIVVLAVKPQNLAEVLDEIKAKTGDKLFISIAAGVRTEKIAGTLGDVAIVRVMPNTPALVGEGASALFANEQAKNSLAKAESIFAAVGQVVLVDDESKLDAVTAISGSGPAYFFLFMEELIKTATDLGLSENVAKKLVLQTAKGAAVLAAQSEDSPEELRKKVTSPGGTTEAALKVFAENDFGKIIANAVNAADKRSKELSE